MRIAFYFTHCETLGHTTRIVALAEGIKGHLPETSLLFLQGGKPLLYRQPFPLVDLPHPFYSREVFAGKKCSPTKEQVKERIKVMYEHLSKFEPDVFITEYFPFGREDCIQELVPILNWLRKKGVKLYASIGYPVISTQIQKVELHHAQFDKLLIHTPEEYDLPYLLKYLELSGLTSVGKWYKQFFSRHKEKIVFTGYVLSPSLYALRDKGREKTIVLSRGGGVIYPKFIVLGLQLPPLFKDMHFVCVPGPATSEKEGLLFKKLAELYGVEYHPHLPTLSHLFATSTASINMAGYGTVVQLLYLGTRSVFVARQKENNHFYLEQQYRAFMAEQLGFGPVLRYENLNKEMLAEALRKTFMLTPIPLPLSCFDGATKTAQVIADACA